MVVDVGLFLIDCSGILLLLRFVAPMIFDGVFQMADLLGFCVGEFTV